VPFSLEIWKWFSLPSPEFIEVERFGSRRLFVRFTLQLWEISPHPLTMIHDPFSTPDYQVSNIDFPRPFPNPHFPIPNIEYRISISHFPFAFLAS